MSDGLSNVLVESDLHWQETTQEIALGYEDLHVWRARIDQLSSCTGQFRESLSSDERARAGRFRFQADRDRFIARRAILRIILSRYLRIAPALIEFAYGELGKPELSCSSRTDLRFSLSHSDGLAFYVVALGTAVGIDVERIREVADADKIVAHYFSLREAANWRSLSIEARSQVFLSSWTRKEARSKAIGYGIANEFRRLQTMHSFDEIGDQVWHIWNAKPNAKWAFLELFSIPNYIASIAVEIRR